MQHLRISLTSGGQSLSVFEGAQDLAAYEVSVICGVQTRREGPPRIMPEIVVLGAGRQNQVVVGEGAPRRLDEVMLCIYPYHLGHQHLGVLLLTQDGANRCGNLISRQQARGDLIEHGTEQMIVVLIHYRHVNRCAGESAGSIETAESAPHDDDMRPAAVRRIVQVGIP